MPFWKSSSKKQKANLSLPVQREGSNKGQEGVGELSDSVLMSSPLDPRHLHRVLLPPFCLIMTETLIDSFGIQAVLEGEGLSVFETTALVPHLWDSVSQNGLGWKDL